MNWWQAVTAMKQGRHVARSSEIRRVRIHTGDPDTVIYDCGTESSFLAAAWSVDNKPVFVFMGAESKCMFCPSEEQMAATDWVET
jgi:hypothetical protein